MRLHDVALKPRALGPACATCREKSRRCDRARPICGRCVSKSLDCGGYPEKFRFCGLASRGKWKGKERPTADNDTDENDRSQDTLREIRQVDKQRPDLRHKKRSVKASRNDDLLIDDDALETPLTGRTPESSFGSIHLTSSLYAELLPADDPTLSTSLYAELLPAGDPTSSTSSPLQLPTPEGTTHEIDHILILEETEKLLMHYDRVICPHQIAQTNDTTENPYRLYVLPLAYEQIGLLYAVLALSACHLGRMMSDQHLLETVAVEYQVKAINALGASIRKGCSQTLHENERDSIFATIQVLLLYDICESGISAHGAHISGAMSISTQLMLGDCLTNEHKRTIFFLGNLAWLDIIRAFAGPERLCFNQELRQTLLSLGDMKFELVNGCPRELVLIIGDVLEHAKSHAIGKLGAEKYIEILRTSIRKLYLWNSSICIFPDDNLLWIHVAEAFRHACILRALRLLDVTESAEAPRIQESVTAILDSVAEIPSDNFLIELMVLPLFMAGADCLSLHSRHYVLLRLSEITRRSEMSIAAPIDLLKTVWEGRARQSQHDRSNVPWMEFTHNPALQLQHDYLII